MGKQLDLHCFVVGISWSIGRRRARWPRPLALLPSPLIGRVVTARRRDESRHNGRPGGHPGSPCPLTVDRAITECCEAERISLIWPAGLARWTTPGWPGRTLPGHCCHCTRCRRGVPLRCSCCQLLPDLLSDVDVLLSYLAAASRARRVRATRAHLDRADLQRRISYPLAWQMRLRCADAACCTYPLSGGSCLSLFLRAPRCAALRRSRAEAKQGKAGRYRTVKSGLAAVPP